MTLTILIVLFVAFIAGILTCGINLIQCCFMMGGSYAAAVIGLTVAVTSWAIYRALDMYFAIKVQLPSEEDEGNEN